MEDKKVYATGEFNFTYVSAVRVAGGRLDFDCRVAKFEFLDGLLVGVRDEEGRAIDLLKGG